MTLPNRIRTKAIQTPWFSEIPDEWASKPIKAVLRSVSRPVGDYWEGTTLLSLTQAGVIPRDIESGKGKFPSDFSTYQYVQPGDLVFCLFDIDETPRAVGLSSLDGMVTGAYNVFETKEGYSSHYLNHLFHWIDNGKLLKPYYTGLRKVVRPQTFGAIHIPLPSLPEQKQIALFLDRETAKIDALIAEQKLLIELLKEKRQAVISHAVTKGLNPNAPMKDSGVEWLGEVPEHWKISPLNYALKAVGDVDHYMPESVDSGIPYAMTGDLEEMASNINLRECKQVSEEDYEKLSKKIKTQKGDLILARYATIGTVSYVDIDEKLLVSYSCVTIKVNPEKVAALHLFYFIKSQAFAEGIKSKINSNTQDNVGIGDLKKILIALPPTNEQVEIIEYLQSAASQVDEQIQVSRHAVHLLRERRSTLISAAVTGQIDVRGLATEEETA